MKQLLEAVSWWILSLLLAPQWQGLNRTEMSFLHTVAFFQYSCIIQAFRYVIIPSKMDETIAAENQTDSVCICPVQTWKKIIGNFVEYFLDIDHCQKPEDVSE